MPLESIGAAERMLIDSMLSTMYELEGVGLAAPQIGINKQLFVADMGEGPIVVANPEIIKEEGSCFLEEGCLSFPGVAVNIERPQRIEVRYLDQNNTFVKRTFTDLMARIFLHENDHLKGRAIVDYVEEKDKDVFEEQLNQAKQSVNQPTKRLL